MAEKKSKVRYSEPEGYFPKDLLAKFDDKPKPKKKSAKKKVSKKK